MVRPKRHRYRHRRHGFHEEFGRPQSANYESDIRSSWVEPPRPQYPTLSQEMLEAFSIPTNALDSVNSSWASPRKPERPSRNSKKRAKNHYYTNVPPLRAKRCHPPKAEWNTSTWPRQDLSAKRPIAPKRLKSKQNSSNSLSSHNYQTWHAQPQAPKRTRSKNQFSLQKQNKQPKGNILIEADTLFGAESRFIDDDDVEERINQHIFQEQNRISMDYNIKVDPEEENEPKILNEKPVVPGRRKTSSLKKGRPTAEEATWPRPSKPSAPRRIKRSQSKKSTVEGENETHLSLEKPSKKVPTVPASTPSETHEVNEQTDADGNSSIQAGLDHILEILATFPQQDSHSPPNEEVVQAEETQAVSNNKSLDENPYAEIKQFQEKKAPPPRPPPPAYAPPSNTSSYSYIYTVPRRKNKTHRAMPERPPRTYCTIRPHRPPRHKRRSHTQEVVFKVASSNSAEETACADRRHSFSLGDDAESKEETNRDLQSSPIINRMRVRPLPPPPRSKRHRSRTPPAKPPRSRNASLRRPKSKEPEGQPITSSKPEEAESVITQTTEIEIVQPITTISADGTCPDEYEPIENPSLVEEISVGIQTDPLPDDEMEATVMDEPQDMEINNNSVSTEPVDVLPVVESHHLQPVETPAGQVFNWSAATSPDPDVPTQDSKASAEKEDNRKVEPSKKSQENTKTLRDDEDEDSYSHMPPNFPCVPSLPPIRLDLPTRLQLSQLDVERLHVREVTAERLVISSVDANSLQV